MSNEDDFSKLKVHRIGIHTDAYDKLVDVLAVEPEPTEALKELMNRPKRWALEEKEEEK